MDKVVVGVPTFRRTQGLDRVLTSLESLSGLTNITVLVADNDPTKRTARDVVEAKLAGGYKWPIEIISVTERGISQARNALLSRAFLDKDTIALAMIDDDQWVEPNWLIELINTQTATGADVVGSWTKPDFGGPPPDWSAGLAVFWRMPKREGPCELIESTCGVLVTRAVFERLGRPFFDPVFSLIGGGDKEYFSRLKRGGATFAFSSRSVCYEVFEADRASPGWAKRRAYRIGATDVALLRSLPLNTTQTLKELLTIPAGIAVGALEAIASSSKSRRLRGELRIHRALGKASAFAGKRFEAYAATSGS